MSDTTEHRIKVLQIVNSEDKTIFDYDNYIIPLYQRAFAWSDKEITQLIDDIYDFEAEKYYIGSLIINVNSNGLYEVIDGQQRLTALYLLLNYLDYRWESDRLRYECRVKSNYTLNFLNGLLPNKDYKNKLAEEDKIEQSLIKGWDIIEQKFHADKIDTEKFKEKLKNVQLFRIEVPPHTDLNRYFEIMNVRGEQLEQHDILKAKLMEPLAPDEQNAFSIIWDACRDMNGYVQMHFSPDTRKLLFGAEWNYLDSDNIFALLSEKHKEDDEDGGAGNHEEAANGRSAIEIIEDNKIDVDATYDGEDEKGQRVRFESIISNFSVFLMHVLKAYAAGELGESSLIADDQTDDKKLLKIFTAVRGNAINNGKTFDEAAFSAGFIKCLLKCRFLFDKYIIKREYKNDDSNGSWSLKELKCNNRKPQYFNTELKDKYEKSRKYEERKENRHINIIMLQSCLRVSYISQKSMHWITELLIWLYNDENLRKLSNLEAVTENFIKKEVKANYLDRKNYYLGVSTPHIVLNYLDYLLWKRDKCDFTFSFQNNSVEHWYPQHPSQDMLPEWDEKEGDRFCRDYIGNICIISREVNSKFSNLAPTSKQKNTNIINNGSLKMRIMAAMTAKIADDAVWRVEKYKEHGNEMLKLLEANCQNIT